MEKDVIFSESSGTLKVILPPEIDHHSAKPIREKTDTEVFRYSPKILILDFSAVRFMDSSGIGLILGRAELCSDMGARIKLVGLSSMQMKLVRLSGIERIKNLSICDI